MALKQSIIASVNLVSASDIKDREVLANRVFGKRFEGNVLNRIKKALVKDDTINATPVADFFWLESESAVQVTITGSNGGDAQVCTCNGFMVWYGAVTGVLITQVEETSNTVNLVWS